MDQIGAIDVLLNIEKITGFDYFTKITKIGLSQICQALHTIMQMRWLPAYGCQTLSRLPIFDSYCENKRKKYIIY